MGVMHFRPLRLGQTRDIFMSQIPCLRVLEQHLGGVIFHREYMLMLSKKGVIKMRYLVDGGDLTSIADAIRAKTMTNTSLAFPTGFTSAINSIVISSGPSDADKIIDGTISTYTNSSIISIGKSVFAWCYSSLTSVSFP